jgi:hypothetical protein
MTRGGEGRDDDYDDGGDGDDGDDDDDNEDDKLPSLVSRLTGPSLPGRLLQRICHPSQSQILLKWQGYRENLPKSVAPPSNPDSPHWQVYQESFQKLRELKGEIESIQRMLEKGRARMQADFDEWYNKV